MFRHQSLRILAKRIFQMSRLATHWQTFRYNFQWSDWVSYVDGWIPRLSFLVPSIGDLIFFNDSIGEILIFKQLANEGVNDFGLNGQKRLRCIYFALISLGVSNIVYRVKRPYIFRLGNNLTDYTKTCLEIFAFQDFLEMHQRIRSEGHFTRDGKYYDSEWDGFVGVVTNTGEGTDQVERDGSWDDARSQYGSLLRLMLAETFFRIDRKRRCWLSLCLVLSTIGYILLLIPSIEINVFAVNERSSKHNKVLTGVRRQAK